MNSDQSNQKYQQPISNKPSTNSFPLIQFLTFGFVMLIIGLILGYVLFSNKPKDIKQNVQSSLPSNTKEATIISNLNSDSPNITFKNEQFSFNYPTDYIVNGNDVLFVGHTRGSNGSCIPGGIQINTTWSYGNALMQSNLNNLQVKTIPNGKLYTGIQRPGACGGITHHIAQLQDKSSKIEISLDGDNLKDLATFNTIISTFLFVK